MIRVENTIMVEIDTAEIAESIHPIADPFQAYVITVEEGATCGVIAFNSKRR